MKIDLLGKVFWKLCSSTAGAHTSQIVKGAGGTGWRDAGDQSLGSIYTKRVRSCKQSAKLEDKEDKIRTQGSAVLRQEEVENTQEKMVRGRTSFFEEKKSKEVCISRCWQMFELTGL